MDISRNRGNARNIWGLWLLIAVFFLAFNLLYWPVQRRQSRIAPENFLGHALELRAQGEAERAMERLRDGIEHFRPPCPEPYLALLEWQSAGGREYVRGCAATAAFYQALQRPEQEKAAALSEAVMAQSVLLPVKPLSPSAANQVRLLAVNLAAVWNVDTAVRTWPVDKQLALLALSGSNAIDYSGQIGRTGVATPVDILVQSGGGHKGRHCTHILVHGLDYAKNQRGFYAVLIDATTGNILISGMFDIWREAKEAARMEAFLNEAGAGCIGAFAVADEASVNLTPGLERALLAFGLRTGAYEKRQAVLFGVRFSFAAIGVKGAPEGSAIQTWSPGEFGGCVGHAVACGALRPAEGGA